MLLDIIADHHDEAYSGASFQQPDTERAFQAAWLAHAVVDGLTPAHHYPYESEASKNCVAAGN
jgi:hypothetical protein